ncbi:MAG TPA: ATP-dependent DNA ligase [Solirubrobacteraceae bacterium]|nr:ATP-dependent DNA ligase [Solirubrobacteraceae bacterium]
MSLPLSPPVEPQLARASRDLPAGAGWVYEPKFDGFRAIVFVDGDEVEIQSRGGRPLRRYFPELAFAPGRYVVDGEIVIDLPGAVEGVALQDFGSLQQRLHPAASRVAMLAERMPARFVAFDLLARDDELLLERPLSERRAALEALAARDGLDLTPWTSDPAATEPWLAHGEGVVAKELGAPYRPGERRGMVKIKRLRTLDAVVAGYRPGKERETVGSLILGLYGPGGELHIVGHSSGIRPAEKPALRARLAPYETGERGHGDPSRWKNAEEMEWVGLRPELVVEVSYDHVSGGRIRHGTKIVRWREDKAPRECLLEQLDQ